MENEYMRLALNEAALAEASGDIPVGAVKWCGDSKSPQHQGKVHERFVSCGDFSY